MRRALIALLGLLCAAALAQPAVDHEAAVSDALRERRTQDALALLADWQRSEQQGAPGFARLYYLGSARQQQGMGTSGSERDAAFAQARAAYAAALELRPRHERVCANLALLEQQAGQAEAAAPWFACAAAGSSAPHALNYAHYLAERGQAQEALRWAAEASRRAPAHHAAWGLEAALQRQLGGAAGLARHLLDGQRSGRTIFAAQTALAALRDPVLTALPAERWALLLVATTALTRDPLLLRDIEGPPELLREPLLALRDDAQLGAAVRQLVEQLGQPQPSRERYSAWQSREALLPKLSARSALRGLAIAKARSASDPARSERWWLLGIELGEQGPDPEAFVGLVGRLTDSGRAEQLKPLMARYEFELFTEKSLAYQQGDWEQIFRLHLALGTVYGHLKVWQSAQSPYQNAVFQLEAAMRAADRANKDTRPGRKPEQALALPAQALGLLADAHAALGNPRRGAELQLEGADRLLQLRRTGEAAEAIEKLSPSKLDAQGNQRYERLTTTLRAAQPSL